MKEYVKDASRRSIARQWGHNIKKAQVQQTSTEESERPTSTTE
jgi:hypothetical protein